MARALLVAVLATSSLGFAPPDATPSYFPPRAVAGKVFPILLPADGRWLNWRDTYGAPRMRVQPDGSWKQTGSHQGSDIYAERGAPVVSMTNGRVERIGWTFYSGWRVGVRGSDGRYYFYAHMSGGPGAGLGVSDAVSAGTFLGRVGSSGYGQIGTEDEFPAHLHFGIQARGRWISAQDLLEELYEGATQSWRASIGALQAVEQRIALLAGRASGPEAPSRAQLQGAVGLAVSERLEMIAAMRYRTPGE